MLSKRSQRVMKINCLVFFKAKKTYKSIFLMIKFRNQF